MKRVLSHPAVLLGSRFVLGMVFIVAAVEKISQPEGFATAIEAYEMTPVAVVNILAVVLPWLELICGLFLIGGVYVRGGSAVLAGLLVLFIVAISAAILRGLNINCGCYGASGGTPVGWNKVLEDVGLLVLAWHLIRFWPSRPGGDATAEAPRSGPRPA